ncbi:MAG: Ureidoglycolate hydrolase [Clostridia bacterium]|nr:Ureidoglycolate hydrolase [Clostridia bacterium]
MKTIKTQPLTHEQFAPFGQFYAMDNPEGYALCGEIHKFFPDRITADSVHRVGYSPIIVKKPEKMIITQQEYHTTTWEMILPLDDDMILHCAPASAGAPVTDYAKAFIVPKNTLVKMNAGIWHLAPLPANNQQLTALIILPECTYANDCTVVDLAPDQQFEIIK